VASALIYFVDLVPDRFEILPSHLYTPTRFPLQIIIDRYRDSHRLVVDALEMALWRRNPDVGLIHHTDRGVQYTALSFSKKLQEAGIVASMGRVGSALDNAISESFVASLKCELLLHEEQHRFVSREAARTAVFDYIEGFYDRVRRHSSLGYLSPAEYEQARLEEVAVA
jgi:putative transposase